MTLLWCSFMHIIAFIINLPLLYLHFRDKAILVMAYSHVVMYLYSICKYFVKQLSIYVHQRYWPRVFSFIVSLSSFIVRVTLTSYKEFGAALFFFSIFEWFKNDWLSCFQRFYWEICYYADDITLHVTDAWLFSWLVGWLVGWMDGWMDGMKQLSILFFILYM